MLTNTSARQTPARQRAARGKSDVASDVAIAVAKNLREARRLRGHSLDALAQISGVSRAMLGQIETGKSIPTVALIWRVADALGIPVADLVSRSNDPPYHIQRYSARRDERDQGTTGQQRTITASSRSGGPTIHEIRLTPGVRDVALDTVSLGIVAVYVAAARIVLTIPDGSHVTLDVGDAVLLKSAAGLQFSNPEDVPAVALVVG
ncbi:MAG: helix-turn-helix transcriptional regulator [Hyphomicrobium sp.]|nr:helix-turn-helix transcriptional regulator [Hyphomicrobium sp.]